METFEYTCDYCAKQYIPGRRGAQRFCKDSCRASWHNRNKKLAGLKANQKLPSEKTETEPDQKNITITGIAEAGIGSLAADGLKSLLTKPENKLVTNGKLDAAVEEIVRRFRTEILLHRFGQIPKSSPQSKKEDNDDFGVGWV